MMQRYAKIDLTTREVIAEDVGLMSSVAAASVNTRSRPEGSLLVPKSSICDGRFIPRLTERQEKQLAHMDRLQSGEELHNLHTYEVSCMDCGEFTACHTAGTVSDFIRKRHMGHYTSYVILGVSNPLHYAR